MTNIDGYKRVYQTWSTPQRTTELPRASHVESKPCNEGSSRMQEMRHRVQRARIERGWSIYDLSQRVKCDVAALADFERGNDVLGADVQRELRTILELDHLVSS